MKLPHVLGGSSFTAKANKGPPLRLLVRLMPRALRRNGGAVEKLEA